MLAGIRKRLDYPHVASTIALVLALGGTTYAATSLDRNSVGPKQIKKNAVRAVEVKDETVGSAEVDGLATRDLGFPLGSAAGIIMPPVTPPPNQFETVLSDDILIGGSGGPLLVMGSVEVTDNGQVVGPTNVQLRVAVDGQPEPATFDDQVPASTTETIPIVIPCDLVPPGTHTIEVQAALSQASTIGDRAFEGYTGPAEAAPPASP